MALVRNLERKLSESQGQYEMIQQECDGHINHIHTLKESNFKLTEGLEEAISKGELYKNKIKDTEVMIANQQVVFEDNKIKMRCTIDQQTKLIDFLQSKTDTKKKKVCKVFSLFLHTIKLRKSFKLMVSHVQCLILLLDDFSHT